MKCYTESGYFFINGKNTIPASNIRIILDKIGAVEYVTLQLISNNQNVVEHIDVTTLENASSVLYADYADFISQTQGSSGTTITGTVAVGGETIEGDHVTGNPVFVGAKAVDVEPVSLTAGDLAGLITTLKKALVIAGYDYDLQALKVDVINPLNKVYTNPVVLVDTTNVLAGTNYYPDANGLIQDEFTAIAFQGITSGGVTTTIEAHLDDSVTNSWLDITPAGFDLLTNSTSNLSFIDKNFILDFTKLNVKAIRIKSVTSDNSNAIKYTYRKLYS